jgi:hypothetical protein
MALTQGARNKIKSFVQEIKKKLIIEFEAQLQSLYGIRPDGTCLIVDDLTSKESSIIQTASLLRGRLEYIKTTIAGEDKDAEAVAQLIREQAFTILNRFAALRMAEERNIIRESIKKGYNSEGFKVYDQLTGGAKSADQFSRYTWYLNAVFDELAVDLPAIFDRYSPYALLFPSEKIVLELLEIINDHQLINYREEGYQLMNLWQEDETIGWVYQYYNSREEISAMRDASGAPRNSRELAVRNQFFTPRYVVQFLVDNSLGQQWFEMTQGNTQLPERCEYMVKRPKVIFLEKGVQVPEEKDTDTHYIDFRLLKDPREILMLDPACGSMHFGLYCFDLYEIIYKEAWDNFPSLMHDLRDKWNREEFIKHIPDMILRHNIHGVDIDPRAIQMAGLSLWLRAQRYYDGLNLQPNERPSINKSNLVVAEPLPGDEKMLNDFAQKLPGPIAKLLRVIWEKMKLAGETGLLLKIEEELKKEIEIAKEEWKLHKDISSQGTLFDSPQESKVAKMAAIYGKGQTITKDFFDTAEEEVLKALKTFAENAQGGNAFQKLLFAEDTARGFAFIELCRKRYDVIVMNPPFGAGSKNTEKKLKIDYSNFSGNLVCAFFERMQSLSQKSGNVGSIYDKVVNINSSYSEFRKETLCGQISFLVDSGWGVLDANVETSIVILNTQNVLYGAFVDISDDKNKADSLYQTISIADFVLVDSRKFKHLPNSILGYKYKKWDLEFFDNSKTLKESGLVARQGHAMVAFQHFRVFWELNEFHECRHLFNGGAFSMFYLPHRNIVIFGEEGYKVRSHKSIRWSSANYQGKLGIGFGRRGDILDVQILKSDTIFTSVGMAIPGLEVDDAIMVCSYLNSGVAQYCLNLYSLQHKQAGYLNLLPFRTPDSQFNPSATIEAINIKYKWNCLDETALEYRGILHLFKGLSLKVILDELNNKRDKDELKYAQLVKSNDQFWSDFLEVDSISQSLIGQTIASRPHDILDVFDSIEKLTPELLSLELLMHLVGWSFGRWNYSKSSYTKEYSITKEEIFIPLNFLQEVRNKSSESTIYDEYLDSSTLVQKIRTVLKSQEIEYLEDEITSLMGSFDELFSDYTKWFNHHLIRYTKTRREAPIYWPIATKSNSFLIWLYYPLLNESTLFSVVNELVDPKIKEITKEVEVLEMSNSSKELNDQKAFLAELEDFKEELLRVAKLPYRPNQDDGVLITAAPLHNLFRHTKWKKATEACWEKLEKGEYDWAHLAYSVWPDRVSEKCKKDLSMAIAHGLEDICEIKPKEKKPRVKKGIKVDKQGKLL